MFLPWVDDDIITVERCDYICIIDRPYEKFLRYLGSLSDCRVLQSHSKRDSMNAHGMLMGFGGNYTDLLSLSPRSVGRIVSNSSKVTTV